MLSKPIFFERNRVGRVYIGGKLFAGLFGDKPEDGYLPEEWIASGVRAINKDSVDPKEGVSKVEGSDIYFDNLLQEHKEDLLGKGKSFRILVKALDSAIRLPAQAHPDKAYSQKYFNSTYGKTECWTILDTRPDAKIFFGFKDGVTKEDFLAAIEASETNPDAMESLMAEITPKVGEVYFVPAKTVHAIGKGCLILEVQEPTDFTIQPERWCGEYKLSDKEMYLGLTKEQAVECFDFCEAPQAKITPEVLENNEKILRESVVSEKHTDCFVINRTRLSGGEWKLQVDNSYAVYIVTEGEGKLLGDGYDRNLKKGDYFFMPACLMGKFTVCGNLEIVECY